MAIYDRPVRILMREMIDQLAPQGGVVFTRSDALNWFNEHYPKVKDGTVSAHLLRFSTNSRSRHHYSVRPDESLLFQIDQGHFRRYDPATDPTPLDQDANGDPGSDGGDEDVSNDIREFAYEKDLRNFLARNLEVIEPGLRLYEEEGITGVEFPVGGRFADLLGVDAEGRLVVIELKVSRGYDRVIGQLLRYMAWISKHQGTSRPNARPKRASIP
ncbi:MAG: endonuclease NucS [Bacillota bacterium]